MKVPRQQRIRKLTSEVCAAMSILALGLTLGLPTNAQPPVTPPIPVTDEKAVGTPERVELGGGKHKKIYRNKAGQIISEETYEAGGGMLAPQVLLERRDIRSVNANGTPAKVEVTKYKDNPDPNILGMRLIAGREEITYNDAGEPIEHIEFPRPYCSADQLVRVVTNWEAGTKRRIVRIQRFDVKTQSWMDYPNQPKPPDNAGPGPTSANTNLPKGTTATAQTRVRANGDDSLLVSLTTRLQLDKVQITLPDSKPLTPGSLPEDWTMKQDGKKVTLNHTRGLTNAQVTEAINIAARLDGVRSKAEPIAVEASYGGKTQFETSITPEILPPVTNVTDISSALNLPPEIVPGKEFLATAKPGFTSGTWRIADGPEGQWINTGDPNYRPLLFKVSEDESPRPKDRVFFRYQYYDEYGELLRDGTDPGLRILDAGALPNDGSDRRLPFAPFAFAGQSTCGRGNSTSPADWFTYTLDQSTPLLPLAASPTTIVLSIPQTTTPGSHMIGGSCPTGTQLPINILGVEGSIDSNKLWTGESTMMRLKVIGTEESLPIVITNNTPTIIDILGGVKQTVSSSGGASNIVTRSVRGIMRGGFQIDYRLDYPMCGGSKAGVPDKKTL